MIRHIRRRMRGFTLLETLVALGIAAMALNGFYKSLSTGSLLEARAEQRAEQVLVATSVLDRVGVDIPIRIGASDNGTNRGLNWTLGISDSPTADMQLGPITPGELVFIAVTVAGKTPEEEPVTLRAIKYVETPL
jgi:prepilin-type N-terminal cleavage/methylation domain-containing protein